MSKFYEWFEFTNDNKLQLKFVEINYYFIQSYSYPDEDFCLFSKIKSENFE